MSLNPATPIELCTVPEIVAHLSERVPVLIISCLMTNNETVCDTLSFTSGNRAACLGLAELLRANTLAMLQSQCEDGQLEEGNGSSGENDS